MGWLRSDRFASDPEQNANAEARGRKLENADAARRIM